MQLKDQAAWIKALPHGNKHIWMSYRAAELIANHVEFLMQGFKTLDATAMTEQCVCAFNWTWGGTIMTLYYYRTDMEAPKPELVVKILRKHWANAAWLDIWLETEPEIFKIH